MAERSALIEVTHFQRQPRKSANFSLEFIFQDIRERLKDKVFFNIVIVPYLSNGIWKRVKNAVFAKKHTGRINHITGDVHYLAGVLPGRNTILTIHDCVFLQVGSPFRRAVLKYFWLTMPVSRVKYLTAISEATKAEIIHETNCDPDKIHIIPVAIDVAYTPHPKPFNTSKPVLLMIGTAPNKNIERTIKALSGLPCEVVIVGNLSDTHWHVIHESGVTCRNVKNLSQEDMIREYIHCDIVMFASTYEGFGMPIIEGNAIERPVITSNISSMPGVAGEAACLVDPFSIESIRDGVIKVIRDEQYREDLIEAGRKNKLRFHPQRIAEQYLSLYQSMS